jgi:hypothetical protein
MTSPKAVTSTAAGILVPWGHPLVDEIEYERDYDLKCSKCGLGASWHALGYGQNGDVCFDCNNEANEVIQRLRSHRNQAA